ncbi:MAG TPA: peptidylprolyl isomerase, partial [Bryobacteraceae bacterium]|nr:peptidylprolyl isomerase [Bryobacteraceae bacterium]
LFSLFAQTPNAAPPAAAKPAAEAAKPEREPGLYATITTSMGTIVAKLFEEESPKTVKNFSDLAMGRKLWTDPKTNARTKRPLYNGLTFHRVIPGFMIQGGDPLGTGTGGTDVIPDEFHPSLMFDRPGRFGMANAGPGTGSSQFFITEGPTTHLNGKHTIFGQVVEGQDVVQRIARVPTGPNDKPTTPVRMTRVTVARVGPAPASAKPAAGSAKPTSAAKPSAAKPKPTASKPAATKPKPAAVKTKPVADPVK